MPCVYVNISVGPPCLFLMFIYHLGRLVYILMYLLGLLVYF